MGMFATIMTELAAPAQDAERVMIVATHPAARRTASGLGLKRGGHNKRGRTTGRTKGGLDPKWHVLADAKTPSVSEPRLYWATFSIDDAGTRAFVGDLGQVGTQFSKDPLIVSKFQRDVPDPSEELVTVSLIFAP